MWSQKTQVVGKNWLTEIGFVRYKWIIKDFKKMLAITPTIRSPGFAIETTNDPDPAKLFHLDMEIPSSEPGTHCPVFLVNETGKGLRTKVELENYSPYSPKMLVMGSYCTSVAVKLASGSNVHTSADRKKVLIVELPLLNSPSSADGSSGLRWSRRTIIPEEVTIEIKVTLCSLLSTIVS
jgi:hypothetical protein